MRKLYFPMLLLGFFCLTILEAVAQRKEDPEARAAYEKRMLIDPKTGEIPAGIRQLELEYVYSRGSKLQPQGYQPLADNWKFRGPWNVGGRVRAIGIDKANEDILLSGGVSGGLYRSTNGGTSWTRVTGLTSNQSVTAIAQDTRTGQTTTWYYVTGEQKGNSVENQVGGASFLGSGVYKSTDNGVTWTNIKPAGAPQSWTDDFQYCSRVVVSPSNGNVYVANAGGIYRSTDGGTTWTKVLDANTTSNVTTDVAVTSTGILYATIPASAGSNQGIRRSSDNGDTWANIGGGASLPADYDRICIGISPSSENNVYFISNAPSVTQKHILKKYTYVSGDGTGGGGTWVDRTANLPSGYDSQGGYDMFVKVHPTNANIVIIGGTSLYRSTDDFATQPTGAVSIIGGYNTLNPPLDNYTNHMADQHELVFYPSNANKAIIGNDGGLTRTDDITVTTLDSKNESVKWTYLNNGFPSTQPYAINIVPTSGDDRIAAGFQDNGCWFVNTDGTQDSWQFEPLAADGAYVALANSGNLHYFSSQSGGLQRATYNGTTIQGSATSMKPTGATGFLFVAPFELDPSDEKVLYQTAGVKIWRNTDAPNADGTTGWSDLTGVNTGGSTITALSVTTTNPSHTIYYGTQDGKLFKMPSANTGTPTQTALTVTDAPSGAYISSIAIDPTDGNKAMVIYSNYSVKSIFYTTDGGTTWVDVSGNLEQNADGTGNGPSVRWGSIMKYNNEMYYYVGTSTGLYSTKALNGTTTSWTQEGSNVMGNAVVSMVRTRGVDGFIAIATHGNGMFSAKLSAPTVTPTPAAPTITSFTPTSGAVGTTVTITGTNFSTTAASNTVKFNGTTATVTASTATSITTTVPTAATTGKISVQVGSNTATSTADFTVTTATTGGGTGTTTVTSVEDAVENGFVVYPNPSKGVFAFAWDSEYRGKGMITVTNMVGDVVYQREISKQDFSFESIIDLEYMSEGVYFLNVTSEEGSFTKKIVKQ